MLIKDVTFLSESQLFDLGSSEQKRVELTLVKLIQPHRPKKLRASFFFRNPNQMIFSMRYPQPYPFKKCYAGRVMVCYGRVRPTVPVATFFDKAIYGKVQNPVTKSLLYNVDILLYPLKSLKPFVRTISNLFGHYLIASLPAGAYRITASKAGYYTFRAQFTLESNHQFNAINIPLSPKPTLKCKIDNLRQSEGVMS